MSRSCNRIVAYMTIMGSTLIALMFFPICASGRVTDDIVEDCIAEAKTEEEMLRCLEKQTGVMPYTVKPTEMIPSAPVDDRIRINTYTHKPYFVGDEPVPIRYDIYVPLHVRIKEINYRAVIKPFELVAVNAESRTAVPNIRDIEVQRIMLLVRLPVKHAYGEHVLPSLSIPYEYDLIAGDVGKGVLSSEEVKLRKVSLFVDVVQEHDIGVIGDILNVDVKIHADNGAEILNEYPPEKGQKNLVYLSGYEVRDPFVLLDSIRDEFRSEHYRIIRWRYAVAAHGIGGEAFELPVPQVVWRKHDEGPVSSMDETLHTVTPGPIRFMLRSITEKGDTFKPMKGVRSESLRERAWLLTLPRVTIWVFYGAGILLVFVHLTQMLRARKLKMSRLPAVEMQERPRKNYDRWPLQKFIIKRRKIKAWETYKREPSKDACKELRDILARRAAMRLGKKERISIQEACAMTASELERLVGETPEIACIRELDQRLETGKFTTLRNAQGYER
jgi:hypothetical protein